MEPIIESHSMDLEEREQRRQEIIRHELSRLHINLKTQNAEIEAIKKDLADFEGQLVRFQPKIKEMDKLDKPQRDFNTYNQSKAYNDYQDYLKEKDRLEGNIQNYKDILEERKEEKIPVEERIKEIEITDPNTLQSASLVRMASRNPVHKDPFKERRSTVSPLQRLRAHGPGFYSQFINEIEGKLGVPAALQSQGYTLKERYPSGGKTRKRTRKKALRK
jgi:predicted  nucleic acid-binding Zn-ribbon protein